MHLPYACSPERRRIAFYPSIFALTPGAAWPIVEGQTSSCMTTDAHTVITAVVILGPVVDHQAERLVDTLNAL